MQKAVIYCRTALQPHNTSHALKKQRLDCKRYARENSIRVVKTFTDVGIDSNSFGRPGMKKLEEYILNNPDVNIVIVRETSRISGHKELYKQFTEEMKKVGTKVLTQTDELNFMYAIAINQI